MTATPSNPIVNLNMLKAIPTASIADILDEKYGTGHWCYVGRGNRRYELPPAPLANPFSHLPHARAHPVATRDEAIRAFRTWLWERLRAGDAPVYEALHRIQPDTVLVCWCAPQPCHAAVIARAAAWLRTHPRDADPSPSATRVVVCGGRTFRDYPRLARTLEHLLKDVRNPIIVSGSAQGADMYGEVYARTHDITCERYPADWKQHGRSAGFLRNQAMVAVADQVIAFWDGQSRGTQHTMGLARAKGIPVRVIRY